MKPGHGRKLLRERREVETEALGAALAERGDGFDDQKLVEPRRSRPVAPHRLQRIPPPSPVWDEVQKTARPLLPVESEHEQTLGIFRCEHAAERHRKTTFGCFPTPLVREAAARGANIGGNLFRREHLTPVSLAPHVIGALPDVTDAAPFQREAADVDDRFVAEIERAQPGLFVDVERLRCCPDARDGPVSLLRVRQEVREKLGPRLGRADRVAGDERNPGDIPVRQERGVIRVEEIVLVVAEREI